MADAKDIPPGTYNLKFGSSFTDDRRRSAPQFHTLRYDFKPNSVANGADTFVAFSNNDDVHVAVPAEGEQLTVFKGVAKDTKSKECFLFFDRKTNTVRIEKMASSINVKKIRDTEPTTEAALRSAISKLGTSSNDMEEERIPEQKPEQETERSSRNEEHESEKSSESSSSSSGSDSDSDSSDNESEKNHDKKTSDSDSDDEKDLLAKMNTTTPKPVEDMPPVRQFSSRPPPSKNNDDLGLNLSESSDED